MITLIVVLVFVTGGIFGFAVSRQDGEGAGDDIRIAGPVGDAVGSVGAEVSEIADAIDEAKARADVEKRAASRVIPHRGSSGSTMEHSFKAYDEALAAGATCLEQDVVVSKDGTLYVSHDDNASRMCGVNKAFYNMTDAEIDQLTTPSGEKVHRLGEIFDKYGTGIEYVVELKDEEVDMTQPFIDLVKQHGYEDRVTAQCFSLDTLKELEDVFPDMPKMYLCKYENLLDRGYEADYVDIIAPRDFMMTEANVKRAHDLGKEFCSWPINSEGWIKDAIDMGVDRYFSDNVELAIKIEKDYGVRKRQRQ